jgi:hypothetical protein
MKMRLSFLALAIPAAVGIVMSNSRASDAAVLTPLAGEFEISGVVSYTANSLDFTPTGGATGTFTVPVSTLDFASIPLTTGTIKDLPFSPFSNLLADETQSVDIKKFLTFDGTTLDFRLLQVRRVLTQGTVGFFLDGYLRNNGAVAGKSNTNVDFGFSLITSQAALTCAQVQCDNDEAKAFFTSAASTATKSYSGTIVASTARKIPEPMTMLGSGLAIASIAALKRKKKSNALKLATSES